MQVRDTAATNNKHACATHSALQVPGGVGDVVDERRKVSTQTGEALWTTAARCTNATTGCAWASPCTSTLPQHADCKRTQCSAHMQNTSAHNTNMHNDVDDGSEMHERDDRLHVGKPLHKYTARARRLPALAVLCTHAEHKCAQCKHAQQLRGVVGAQGAIMPGAS